MAEAWGIHHIEKKKEESEGIGSVPHKEAASLMSFTRTEEQHVEETAPDGIGGPSMSMPLGSSSGRVSASASNASSWPQLTGLVFPLLVEFPLLILFASYVVAFLLHKVHDDYLFPQLELIGSFYDGQRELKDMSYYMRTCDGDDVSADKIEDLLITPNFTTEEAVNHMLTHGASMYPNLLTPETASELQEWIAKENLKRKGWHVIENEHRYSWGIDVNMHPKIHTYWKELASNEQFVKALQAIVGPDPAIIEFTAITSSYGAVDQFDHADVVPAGSATKYHRSFVPSYSLFIPLQDTTYDMGATHVCPGTHLCSSGYEENCPAHNLAMSGPNGVWKQGWGAFVNQQTIHKGMGHFREGAKDRVVLIATFAPRPRTPIGLESRRIGQGGSYSMLWNQWGHTFSDFIHADERMTEPQKTLRSMGLIKGGGWTWPQTASMRMAAFDMGYNEEGVLDEFLKDGGFWFLPSSWHVRSDRSMGQNDKFWHPNFWHSFLYGTLKRTEAYLLKYIIYLFSLYVGILLVFDQAMKKTPRRTGSVCLRGARRLVFSCGLLAMVGLWAFRTLEESNWAKDIKAGRSFKLPEPDHEDMDIATCPPTFPITSDILINPDFSSDYLASWTRVLDFAHPGNKKWKEVTAQHAKSYAELSPKLKRDFCSSLTDSIRVDQRFLIQDSTRQWIEVSDDAVVLNICHEELLGQARPLVGALLGQLESLKTETRYGRWSGTALHRWVIPGYLDHWERQLIPQLPTPDSSKPRRRPAFYSLQSLTSIQDPNAKRFSSQGRRSLPPHAERQEPYPGAWLTVGDKVEAMFDCLHDEWYSGKITAISPFRNSIDVQYDDGEIEWDLHPLCVRRFLPYQEGEVVEALHDEVNHLFHRGTIIREYDGNLYGIEGDGGLLMEKVPAMNIRRFTNESYEMGDLVNVLSLSASGEIELWPGKIVGKEDGDEGTKYAVEYDDDDFDDAVPTHLIRLQAVKFQK